MFEHALDAGPRVGMLATFEPSVASVEREFREIAAARGRTDAAIETIRVEGAMAALKSGDGVAHDRLLAGAAPRLADRDAVLPAHFSTARARPAVQEAGGAAPRPPGAHAPRRRRGGAEAHDRRGRGGEPLTAVGSGAPPTVARWSRWTG